MSVLSPAGELLAGAPLPGDAGPRALDDLRRAAAALLAGMSAACDVVVVTAGSSEGHLVAAFAPGLTVALHVDSAALAPVVSGRLRRDLAGD